MGLERRVMADESDAAAALKLWGLAEVPVREGSGLNKDTWRVGTAHWLAADSPQVADLWLVVEELLRQPELTYFELPQAVPSVTGHSLPIFRGHLWRLATSVEGAAPVPSSADHLDSVAAGLARLHTAMLPLPQKFGVHGVPTHTFVERARDLVVAALLPFTADETAIILTGLRLLGMAGMIDDQLQLIHGDPSYPNLRLGASGALNGVIDWEAVRWDSPLHDLAVVGQTVLYRSGWTDTWAGLQRLLDGYARAGGRKFAVRQLLLAILGIKFGSIAHHGQRLVDGRGDVTLVRSQAEKIAVVCQLLRSKPS